MERLHESQVKAQAVILFEENYGYSVIAKKLVIVYILPRIKRQKRCWVSLTRTLECSIDSSCTTNDGYGEEES